MRVVHTLGAVVACGLIAGLSGLLQSAPSRAASYAVPPTFAVASAPFPAPAEGPVAGFVEVGRSGSVEAHFAAANTTHDGHLTREQALQADWPKVARHFDDIDTDHKGWVSVAQIHRYNKSHHKQRKARPA